MAAVAEQSQNSDKPKRRIIAKYDYTDAAGTMLYQALRLEPKGFAQRRPRQWRLDLEAR
jgi:hypothetical protein